MSNERDIHSSCKKSKAYAWAKYYEAMGRQADNAVIVVRQVPMQYNRGVITVDTIPTHFSTEFIEMAKELRKEFSCPICFDMVNSDTIDITHCGHIYCKTCMTALKAQEDPKCAICRKKLPTGRS
jgi:translation initiation factor 1 (eIF-1/SUI1)